MKILVINGPNINLLGIRERNIYGDDSYEALLEYIGQSAKDLGVEVEFFQSNHEGALVDAIQGAYQRVDAIIINPAAYTLSLIHIFSLIKGAEDVIEAAIAAGAIGCVISGSGPSMISFTENDDILKNNISAAMSEAFADNGVEAKIIVVGMDNAGTIVAEK